MTLDNIDNKKTTLQSIYKLFCNIFQENSHNPFVTKKSILQNIEAIIENKYNMENLENQYKYFKDHLHSQYSFQGQ